MVLDNEQLEKRIEELEKRVETLEKVIQDERSRKRHPSQDNT